MIIMIKKYLNIIIGVLTCLLTLYFSSLYYNNKIDSINKDFNNYKTITEKNIQEQKISILEQNNKLKNENIELIKQLKDLENDKYNELQKLQNDNKKLKSDIINSNKRLYINAECAGTEHNKNTKTGDNTTSNMDNGTTSKAVINSRDAELIISITEKADKYKLQLEALQDWVNMLILKNNSILEK